MKSRVSYGPRKELYDYLKDRDYGFEIAYERLESILGRSPQGAGRADILQVREWLIDDWGKYLECDIGKGYFIAHAAENRDVANKYNGQAYKKVRKSLRILGKTDLTQLTAEQYQSHVEDQKRTAIKYLVMTKINKVKQIDAEPITIPTGRELIDIYQKAI